MPADNAEFGDDLNMGVEKGVTPSDGLELEGDFTWRCFNEDGELKWEDEYPNLVTDEGENHALGVILASATQITSWAVGLVATGSSTASEGFTLGATAFSEETRYSEASRQSYDVPTGTPTGQSIDNTGSPAAFSITFTGSVQGAFVASTNTKGGTGGILYNIGTDTRTVSSGDTISVEYTNNAGGS